MRVSKKERADRKARSLEWLRKNIDPGDTLYTVVTSVTGSGMSRTIMVLTAVYGEPKNKDHVGLTGPVIANISHHVANVLDRRLSKRDPVAVVEPGCGMDLGFHLVYGLSRTLFGPGQVNGRDAGYVLKQEWL